MSAILIFCQVQNWLTAFKINQQGRRLLEIGKWKLDLHYTEKSNLNSTTSMSKKLRGLTWMLKHGKCSGKLRHRLKGLKDPPQRMQRSFLMTQKDPNKRVPQRYHKIYLTKIVLENSSQASRDIPWIMTSQNLFSQTGQGC